MPARPGACAPNARRLAGFRRTFLMRAAKVLAGCACLALAVGATFAQDSGGLKTTGGASGVEVRTVLGLNGANNLGGGSTFGLGVIVAADGPTSTFGQLAVDGASLAVAQIEAAGGPNIRLLIQRVRHGDSVATALGELAGGGAAVVLTAGIDISPQLAAGLGQYKLLGLDGQHGLSDSTQGTAFLWGTRAMQPDDDFAGALQYLTEVKPATKNVSLVYRDEGPESATLVSNFTQALLLDGLKLGSAEATTSGDSDYSAAVLGLTAANSDAVFVYETGTDLGYFLKQLHASGLKAQIIGTDYSAAAAEIAGSSFDNYLLASDWFDANHTTNNWASLFVRSYRTAYGMPPEVYAANAYEDTFAVWTLIRRLLAKGKSPTTGQMLQDELIANHGFKSVYGGDGADLDDILLDTKSHRVIERPFGVYRVSGGDLAPVARFDIGGANFELSSGG